MPASPFDTGDATLDNLLGNLQFSICTDEECMGAAMPDPA